MNLTHLLKQLSRPFFGSFENEEFKKFCRLGFVFTLVIGSFWTLHTLKNATFCTLVSAAHIPWAKTLTLISLIPLVSFYNYMLDYLNRERMFYFLCALFCVGTLLFALAITNPSIGQASAEQMTQRSGIALYLTYVLGYAWFLFIESYGLFFIALFWAIASDTTQPESAKQGFYLISAIGQIGGICAPVLITKIPRLLGYTTNAAAIGCCAILIIAMAFAMHRFFAKTPEKNLESYHGVNEEEVLAKQEPGFWEGLKLLFNAPYLFSIFVIISFFEIIVAIFDFHFQIIAAANYSGTALAEFQGMYGSLVNLVTFICLVFGTSNITKRLGIKAALCLMPLIMIISVVGFIYLDSLLFLLSLMIGSKALNYSLNQPAIKQLYIPTTHEVRFKAQAWIEAFGYHGSKQGGAIFNMLLGPMQSQYGMMLGRVKHIMYSSYLCMLLIGFWLILAWYLGNTYEKTIEEKKVVC